MLDALAVRLPDTGHGTSGHQEHRTPGGAWWAVGRWALESCSWPEPQWR